MTGRRAVMKENEYAWQSGSGPAAISASEIHLWRISLEQSQDRIPILRGTLSPDERRMAEAFRAEKDRSSFCLCRGFLRMLLGRYSDAAPAEVRFRRGEYGKLSLDPLFHQEDIEFNLSHSGCVAFFALARERRLGVDVEKIRTTAGIGDISRGFFSPEEDGAIRALPEGMRADAFYACWTRKEAVVKAVGGSIVKLAGKVIVSAPPDEPARLLRLACGRGENNEWRLQDLPAGEGYAAALCYEGPRAAVFLWEPDE